MNTSLIRFLFSLLIFASCLSAIIWIACKFAPKYYDTRIWGLLLFFVFTTAMFHVVMLTASVKKPQQFIRSYMALTGIRLFFYFCCLAIYLWFHRSSAVSFFIMFFILYLCFSVMEIIIQLKNLNNK